MVFSFMYDGIPVVYYGQEQGMHGASDPVSIDDNFSVRSFAEISSVQSRTSLAFGVLEYYHISVDDQIKYGTSKSNIFRCLH